MAFDRDRFMATTYGYATSEWDDTRRWTLQRLRTVTSQNTTITYRDLCVAMSKAGVLSLEPHSTALAGLLGQVNLLEHEDLANGRLYVLDAKTDAGRRTVDLSPDLREELSTLKAKSRKATSGDLVFTTKAGTPRDRHNVRSRVLVTSIRRANAKLAEQGRPPIQSGVTNHSLRRTFASLLYEARASPAYVMGQMGHTSAAMALEVYSRMMGRDRDTGARMDALLRGSVSAQIGTNGATDPRVVAVEVNA